MHNVDESQVRVSIIIPCFNQGHFVDQAVDAVLAQSWPYFEIIIVNDGSTDSETNHLLSEYSRPKTTVLTTENQGLAAARNNGISVAKGEYILPLDADDTIGPSYLEKAVALLDEQPDLGIVYCQAELFGAVKTRWDLPEFSLDKMLLDNIIFCTALFRRADWKKAGGYDVNMLHGWEDYDFWLSLLEMERKVYQIPEVLFYYRVAEDSMVRARPREHKLETFAAIFRKHQKFFTDNIEIWVDTLLDCTDSYHEASLLVPGCSTPDPAFVRKVDLSSKTLTFLIPQENLSDQFVFYPVNQPVILKIYSCVLEQEDSPAEEMSFTHNADIVSGDTYYFCSEHPCLQLSSAASTSLRSEKSYLRITLEYLAFGEDCLPLVCELAGRGAIAGKNTIHDDPREAPLPVGWLAVNRAMLKRQLKSWIMYFRNGHYRKLQQSSLFNSSYYLSQDPSFPALLVEPLVHYVETGWREGRNPHPLFEADWYRDKYSLPPEQDSLLDYIETGWQAGRKPNVLFFTSWYSKTYAGQMSSGLAPLADFCQNGWQAGRNPNPLFDTHFYIAEYMEDTATGVSALGHYIAHGCSPEFDPAPFFDSSFYLEDNPAVARSGQYPLLHFYTFGADEGRSPHRLFDPLFYQEDQGLRELSPLELFIHFSEHGSKNDARSSQLFDPLFYTTHYGHEIADFCHPLRHYTNKGVFEGNYPCAEVADLEDKPVISILTPVFNTDELLLRRCIHSVLYQAYPHWQLCLVDDGSTAPHIRDILQQYAKMDSRIKVDILEQNQGISVATNRAAELATGEYLAFLDHDDELTIDALFRVVESINVSHPDVLYSDEELIDRENRFLEGFYKPDFNTELLLCHNYITHFFVTRRSLFDQVGGLSTDCAGAQDYDLALKTTELAAGVHHIRRSLYRWRATETSTSVNHDQKDYADAAGRLALQKAVQRRGLNARVQTGQWKYYYELSRRVDSTPHVSVFILLPAGPGNAGVWLERFITGCRYPAFDIQLLHPASWSAEVIEELPPDLREKITTYETGPSESIAWACNRVSQYVSGEHLVFLRGGLLPKPENWLEILLGYSVADQCGVVGGLIEGEKDLEVNPAMPDVNDTSCQTFRSFLLNGSVHLNGIVCPQNVLAVSFDFCMVKRSLFLDAGGFDSQRFADSLYDLDFCLRLRKSGLEHVVTPLSHAVNSWQVAKSEDTAAMQTEKKVFQQRWQKSLQHHPYFNERGVILEQSISLKKWQQWLSGSGS